MFQEKVQKRLELLNVGSGMPVEVSEQQFRTVFRNDKLKDIANPATLRFHMHEKRQDHVEELEEVKDWSEEQIVLGLFENISLKHHKIKLDIETGAGEYAL